MHSGIEILCSMANEARLDWHGVFSRFLGHRILIIGRYVFSYFRSSWLSSLCLPQEFEELPGASSVVFNIVPSVPLLPLLPNIPPSSVHPLPNDPTSTTSPVVDLISQFLVYPATSRLRAEDAIRHPWFIGADSTLLLPKGYTLPSGTEEFDNIVVYEWKGKTLGQWLHSVLLTIPSG